MLEYLGIIVDDIGCNHITLYYPLMQFFCFPPFAKEVRGIFTPILMAHNLPFLAYTLLS